MDATDEHPAADYSQEALERDLRAHGYTRVTVLDSVGSTNTWLAERVAAAPSAAPGATPATPGDAAVPGLEAVVTGFQSTGRGRLDRQWVTPAGTAVTFSVACTPVDAAGRPWSPELLPWLTLLMAHAVTGAVRDLTGVPAVVKWPNDVLVRDRKLCGILATVVASGAARSVVVGAGINVSQRELPVPAATSLRLEAPDAVPPRPALLTAVLERFADVLTRASRDPGTELGPHGSVRMALEAELDTLGREVAVHLPGAQRPLTATATGLGASGQLVVRERDGSVHEYSAGDVVHVRPARQAPAAAAHEPGEARA
ncbi:biotin--[acetyl-CoA-carboxylase] ligase [Kocuria sp.]|uniref:biotin--[acetyl-CoA-carboxylase] ligase n=1 Tax=Kocuria sp. TaxID=1871328 RepID=UPI0026DB0269|nr:biotin--[acetyl-CoA-carboxylase] ligase [Kocuria sp.]MDO4919683.1 biotin--[acetyl-CoA-carboxylase] ligase [Kocuria sp.]